MKGTKLVVLAAAVAALTWSLAAQEAEDRTLLSWDEMRAIINEASGERAMHHVLELVPYPRVRPLSEYQGHFRESEVMARFAREYGYSDVAIESFPSPQRLWQPVQGELWMVEPQVRKLYDIYDVAVSFAANSPDGDVTAELVDVGVGRPQDFDGRDVAGKIVLASGGVDGQVYAQATQRGAVGVVGYSSLRPDDYPDQIPSSRVPANGKAFGWAVSPRVGRELAGLLARGQTVRLRSIIEAQVFPGELEVVHATIPGDGSTDQAVAVSAHLYEGYLKQGANDDTSGCALTLEIGRAYLRLVKEGKLPKPRRTVHFLWVPEISGTNAWLDAHPDIAKRLVADLNFDIAQSFMEFVAELNRERVRYRSVGYAMTLPIVSPNGSYDPFYIKIDKHYGASDHVTYMQRGIPSVMFITWPDMWYHSSQDTPDKQDPTQDKRGAVVGIGALAVLAASGDELAARVTAESIARGAERMGAALCKGLGYLADAARGAELPAAFKEARVAVRHQAAVEKAVIGSSAVLYTNPAGATRTLEPVASLVDARATMLLNEVQSFYTLVAEQRGVTPIEPPLALLEQEASRLLVERVAGAGRGRGAGAGPGGGAGAGRGAGGGGAGAEAFQATQAALARIPQHMRAELNIPLGQKKTALEIRDFLSGEFEPLPLADLMADLRALEQAGSITLTPLPPPAKR